MLPMERHKAVTAAAQNAQKCDVYMHEIVPSSIDCLKKATAAGQEVLQMTETQRRVMLLVNELVSAQDWKGILARENEFRATAVALQAAGRSLTLLLPANARTRLTCPPHSHGQIRPTPMPSTRISVWHMRCLMSRSSEPSSRPETRQGRLGSSDSACWQLLYACTLAHERVQITCTYSSRPTISQALPLRLCRIPLFQALNLSRISRRASLLCVRPVHTRLTDSVNSIILAPFCTCLSINHPRAIFDLS